MCCSELQSSLVIVIIFVFPHPSFVKVTISGIFFLNIPFFAEHEFFHDEKILCCFKYGFTYMLLHVVLYALQKSHKKVPDLSSCGSSDTLLFSPWCSLSTDLELTPTLFFTYCHSGSGGFELFRPVFCFYFGRKCVRFNFLTLET